MGRISQVSQWFKPSEVEAPEFIANFRRQTTDSSGITQIEKEYGVSSTQIDSLRRLSPAGRLISGLNDNNLCLHVYAQTEERLALALHFTNHSERPAGQVLFHGKRFLGDLESKARRETVAGLAV